MGLCSPHSIAIGHENKLITVVDINLKFGNSYHVIGNNGCGKTTFLKTLAGIYPMVNKSEQYWQFYQQTILMPDNTNFLQRKLSVNEHYNYYRFNQTTPPLFTDLKKITKVENLSKGQKQKLALNIILSKDYKIWLLDEPFNGLDNHSKSLLISYINQHLQQDGGIVILCHHEPIKLFNMHVIQI